MDKCLNLLGLAKKAGCLEIGEESVSVCAERTGARAILSASDASEGSKRKAGFLAEEGSIPHIILPYTKADLSEAVGRGAPGILALTDIGFAASFAAKLAEMNGEYTEAAQWLALKQKRARERRAAHKAAAGSGKRTGGKGR